VKRSSKTEISRQGQESVWNYPRPPKLERIQQRIRVEFGGLILAETNQGYRILETGRPPVYYFPPFDVRTLYLALSSIRTFCEYKGVAQYWSIKVNKQVALEAVWSYIHPSKGFEPIRDYFAFFPGKMDACYVGKQIVTAQEGRGYRGWITPNIIGPFKNEPRTEL